MKRVAVQFELRLFSALGKRHFDENSTADFKHLLLIGMYHLKVENLLSIFKHLQAAIQTAF